MRDTAKQIINYWYSLECLQPKEVSKYKVIPKKYVVNVNIRMYNFDDVQCTVIPSVAYGFVTGMNLQLC